MGQRPSRAPFGESPTGTGGSRVLPPEEAAARDAQQGDRDGRAPPFSKAKPPRLPLFHALAKATGTVALPVLKCG